MERKLTTQERQRLVAQHRKERDKRICDRIKAVLAYDEGYSYAEIAKILLLDDETIRRHIQDYLDRNKLAPENGGSEGQLSKAEAIKLKAHLKKHTYLYVKDICHYVKSSLNKQYSISGMTKWLKANDFRYKKPHAVPAKVDKEAQKNFLAFYRRLKAKAQKNQEPIYFSDSVHPQHQTQLAYGWIPKGERKGIHTTAKQKRLNIMGGICLNGHRFFYQETDKVNADSIALFLTTLRKRHAEKCLIHLIWDNAGYHRDGSIQAFAKDLGIKIHYLPPYSPNLNPIERMWKLMRESVMYNKYYANFLEFSNAAIHFFKNIGRKKTTLRSRITDNFQTLDFPILAS